mmetsp:Transcript_5744/g.22659  ORF Transcript_5744/g.22659 Transcript_5744/m.22659 type:complete len:265 (+) Transcript_5744:1696-2490(+)
MSLTRPSDLLVSSTNRASTRDFSARKRLISTSSAVKRSSTCATAVLAAATFCSLCDMASSMDFLDSAYARSTSDFSATNSSYFARISAIRASDESTAVASFASLTRKASAMRSRSFSDATAFSAAFASNSARALRTSFRSSTRRSISPCRRNASFAAAALIASFSALEADFKLEISLAYVRALSEAAFSALLSSSVLACNCPRKVSHSARDASSAVESTAFASSRSNALFSSVNLATVSCNFAISLNRAFCSPSSRDCAAAFSS